METFNQSPANEALPVKGNMQTVPEGVNPQARKSRITTRKSVLGAIGHAKNPSGASLADIQGYAYSMNDSGDAMAVKELMLFLKNAVDSGTLEKLGGKYRVKETARKRRSRSKSPGRRRRRSGSKRRSKSRSRSRGKGRSRKRSRRSRKGRSKSKRRSPSRRRRRRSRKSAHHHEHDDE